MYIHSVTSAVVVILLKYLPPPCMDLLTCNSTVVVWSTSLYAPVEDVVVLVALSNKEVAEELAKVRVIRFVVKAKGSSIVQKYPKLVRETTAKEVCRSGHLFLHDAVVFLLLGGSLKALPRKSTTKEVHENISERFEIVPTSLLDSQMCINRCVTCSACQILVLPVRNMQMGLRVAELFRQAKIDDVDLVTALANAHEEVIRLDVSVDEIAGVDVFDARYLKHYVRWCGPSAVERYSQADQQGVRQS